MMLLLATYRRLTLMDKWVREGRWREGRPLCTLPRRMGQTLGFVDFGHVPRAVATAPPRLRFRMLATTSTARSS